PASANACRARIGADSPASDPTVVLNTRGAPVSAANPEAGRTSDAAPATAIPPSSARRVTSRGSPILAKVANDACVQGKRGIRVGVWGDAYRSRARADTPTAAGRALTRLPQPGAR